MCAESKRPSSRVRFLFFFYFLWGQLCGDRIDPASIKLYRVPVGTAARHPSPNGPFLSTRWWPNPIARKYFRCSYSPFSRCVCDGKTSRHTSRRLVPFRCFSPPFWCHCCPVDGQSHAQKAIKHQLAYSNMAHGNWRRNTVAVSNSETGFELHPMRFRRERAGDRALFLALWRTRAFRGLSHSMKNTKKTLKRRTAWAQIDGSMTMSCKLLSLPSIVASASSSFCLSPL